MKYAFVFLCFLALSCSKPAKKIDTKAQQIVAACVEKHGGKNYEKFDVSFDFRKFHFRISKDSTSFRYERTQRDSLNNVITDILTDQSFERQLNGKKQDLNRVDEGKFREATNSVAYFVMLPYKLLDKAVNLEFIGETNIGGQPYQKIKVWFDAEGGGQDHTDLFCYWINKNTHTLDYLAYENGGPRFRKAVKQEIVDGIMFQDYENYEILDSTIATTAYDVAFMAGKAKLLSVIEQKNYTLGGN